MKTNDANTSCRRWHSPLHRWLLVRRLRKLQLDSTQLESLNALLAALPMTGRGQVTGGRELNACISAVMADQGFTREMAAEKIQLAAAEFAERATELFAAFAAFYRNLDTRQQQQLQAWWRKRANRGARCCRGQLTDPAFRQHANQ